MAAQTPVKQASYTFDSAGGMRDQLEQAILNEASKRKYPLAATIDSVKAGKGLMGALTGSKEQCVTIDAGDGYTVAVSCTTVGTYLYVCIYLLVPSGSLGRLAAGTGAGESWAASVGDFFKLQKLNAYYEVAVAITEAAIQSLGLKQANYGYKRNN